MSEYFDILDDNGLKTGKTKLRNEVHRDGDWHKAVHIWIVNDKNEILLQKRAPNKDSHPNMWDISSAGHLTAGDNSLDGAVREIQEELGIDIAKEDFQLLGTLKRASKYTPTFINNEFDDVYLVRLSLDICKVKLQECEVSAIKYVSVPELKNMIARKDPTLLMHLDEFK
ncbi:MAG: NUDIX domain-containing protein, partial [Rickettsiales bacterium]|nr:NUDIX domain-containing protein [Rickettsiales bacterium]